MAEIRLERVSKVFAGGLVAVNDLSLPWPTASSSSSSGRRAAARRTLLRIIAGLEEPTGGAIFVGERERHRPRAEAAGLRDGVPELRALPAHDVEKNLGFGLKLRRVPKAERRQRVAETSRILGLETCSTASRASSPAASASAWRWAGRSCASRRRSSWTSRSRTSTRRLRVLDARRAGTAPRAAAHDDGVRDARPGRGDDARRPGRGDEGRRDPADRRRRRTSSSGRRTSSSRASSARRR